MSVSEKRKIEAEDIIKKIKSIDLKEYASKNYGISSDNRGFARCPDHPPDNHPSLQFWIGDDGIHRYTDHHTQGKGTIIDFVVKNEHCTEREAISRIKQNEGLEERLEEQTTTIEHFIYKTPDNQIAYRKAKKVLENGEKTFWFEHMQNGKWAKGKGECELIPYNLPASKEFHKAIICEGEKDVDTVKRVTNKLELKYWVTSAPNGMGAWPDSLNKYFSDFNEIVFLYDVGEEANINVQKHASKLLETFPEVKVFVAKVPLDYDDADITDYLAQETNKEMAFLDILNHVEEFKPDNNGKPDKDCELKIETLEEFMSRPVPDIERLIDPYIERNGYTLVGGTKGVGKSLFVTQMALSYASGKAHFLRGTIEKPGKVLLIQQEVAESGMHNRLKKMVTEDSFLSEGRFHKLTTTGNQLNLTKKEDLERVKAFIEEVRPDVLILDPLYTFFPNELNQYKEMSQIVSVLLKLKTNYNLGLVVVHHFSNKRNPDEPIPATGRFMGHSNLANAADVTIGMDFLHPKFQDQVLPLPYNHYASVDIRTRHGEWPERFYIERRVDQLLFRISSIWDEIGKKVPPDEIVEFIIACGGEKLQKDVIAYFEKTKEAHSNTIRKSIKEAIQMGKIKKDPVPGTNNKKILRVIKQEE